MDIVQEMLDRALDGFDSESVPSVKTSGHWSRRVMSGPVRDLVNHVVWVQRWTPLLIADRADRKEPVELINLEQAIRKHRATGVRNGA